MRLVLDSKSLLVGAFAGAALVAGIGAADNGGGEVGRYQIAASAQPGARQVYLIDTGEAIRLLRGSLARRRQQPSDRAAPAPPQWSKVRPALAGRAAGYRWLAGDVTQIDADVLARLLPSASCWGAAATRETGAAAPA